MDIKQLLLLFSLFFGSLASANPFGHVFGKLVQSRLAKGVSVVVGAVCSALKTATTAKAEHIFYKEDGKPLTKQEHAIAYNVMLKHQFPTAPHYNPNYDPKANETKQIQKELNEYATKTNCLKKGGLFSFKSWFDLNKTLETKRIIAKWIPTTLYEFIYCYRPKNSQDNYSKDSDTVEDKNIAKHRAFNHVLSQMSDKQIKSYIPKYDFKKDSYEIDALKDMPQLHKKKAFIFPIHLAIKKENYNHRHGDKKWILYRAVDDKIPEISQELKFNDGGKQIDQYSYSTSLFDHYSVNDKNAFNLYNLPSIAGKNGMYGLEIDKRKYVGELKDLFYIPALTTIERIQARGPDDHSYTKVLIDEETASKYINEHNEIASNKEKTLSDQLNRYPKQFNLHNQSSFKLEKQGYTLCKNKEECKKLDDKRRKYTATHASLIIDIHKKFKYCQKELEAKMKK